MSRDRTRQSALALLACVTLTGACNDRPVTAVPPDQAAEQRTDIPVRQNRDLDILFVIDNSRSMETEQESLAENFDRLAAALDDPALGLPSLHIGVVTTDVGAGDACPDSQAGELVRDGTGCSGPNGRFIEDIARDDGSRATNYSGTLEETFSCIARVGTKGCGFEQPLEAMRRALENPDNGDFLRDEAYLLVVFITDEDDCSAMDPGLFARADIDSDLGPRKSFRCFEFGVECEGPPPRTPGVRTDCEPRSDSRYMVHPSEYVDFLRGLKPYPNQVLVASIAGPLSPVEVILEHDEQLGAEVPALKKSCEEEAVGEAVPPIRLHSVLEGFPGQFERASICDEDLTRALDVLGDFLDDELTPCVEGPILDVDPATPELDRDCTVTEVRFPGTADEEQELLPECDDLQDPAASGNLPCYAFVEDEACSDYPTGLALEVHYPEDVTVPPGTRAVARCASP